MDLNAVSTNEMDLGFVLPVPALCAVKHKSSVVPSHDVQKVICRHRRIGVFE